MMCHQYSPWDCIHNTSFSPKLKMYEWAQQVRVLHYNIQKRLAREKQYNLVGPLESYEENAVF